MSGPACGSAAGRLLALPTHLRRRLAAALDAGLLAAPFSPPAVRSALGSRDGAGAVAEALGTWSRLGVSGAAAAEWLRSLDQAAAGVAIPDFVWSGPEVPGLHARDTRRVYEELIGAAVQSIWISSFAWFDGPRAFGTLARRLDAEAGLDVTLLLNVERRRGDTTAADQLVRRFADSFWNADWPGSARPNVYYDPRALDPGGPSGVLHAKAVVADEEAVFITSANLTEAAFDRNVETGLLLRDRTLAATVLAHFRGLIDRELLRQLPAA